MMMVEVAPNDTAYKRWSCHSSHKMLGFLKCDDICMCVVNKQFEVLELG